MADDISIAVVAVQAELSAFRKEMGKLGPEAAAAAKDMTKALQKELRSLPKDAAANSKAARAAMDSELKKIADTTGFLKEKFTETFGLPAELITEMIGPIGSAAGAMGGLGAAATGVGVGIAAAAASAGILVAAAASLAGAAVTARDRLVEQGRAAELPPTALASLRDYELASRELSVALDTLTVVVGGAIADDLAVIASATADVVRWSQSAVEVVDDLAFAFAQQSSVLGPLVVVANNLWGAYKSATLAELEAEAAAREHAKSEREMLIALGLLDESLPESGKKLRAYTEIRKEANKVAVEAAEIAKYSHEQLVAAVEFQTENALVVATMQVEASQAVEAQIESERQTYLQAMRDESAARAKAIEEERARAEALIDVGGQISQNFADITGAYVNSYQIRADEGEKLTQKQKEQAMMAFEVQQAFAIVGATISAIQAGVNTVNALTAAFVPFPAALILGAGVTTTLLTGQVAAIEQTPPPEFPMGRSPDHVKTASLRDDEGVANPRAMRELGGPEGLDRLNKGQGMASGEGQEMVKLLRELVRNTAPSRGPSVMRLSARKG